MTMKQDLADREKDIHWPEGFNPSRAAISTAWRKSSRSIQLDCSFVVTSTGCSQMVEVLSGDASAGASARAVETRKGASVRAMSRMICCKRDEQTKAFAITIPNIANKVFQPRRNDTARKCAHYRYIYLLAAFFFLRRNSASMN